MLKKFRFGFFLLCAGVFAESSWLKAQGDGNLVMFGDFQRPERIKAVSEDWTPRLRMCGQFFFYNNEQWKLEIIPDPFAEAKSNMVVKITGIAANARNACELYTHNVPLVPDKPYALSVRYLTAGSGKGAVRIKWKDESEREIKEKNKLWQEAFELAPSPGKWTTFEAQINSPKEKAEWADIVLCAQMEPGASIFFDDLKFIPLFSPAQLSTRELNQDLGTSYREGNDYRWKICLNGLWKLTPADLPGCKKREVTGRFNQKELLPEIPADFLYYCKVPGRYDGKEFYLRDQHLAKLPMIVNRTTSAPEFARVWYQRELIIPAEWKNKNLHLFFEGVATCAYIFLNKKYAGIIHEENNPHKITVSHLVKYGESNRLDVLIAGSSDITAKDCWICDRGIRDNVWLEVTPATLQIDTFQIISQLDQEQLKVIARLVNNGPGTNEVVVQTKILQYPDEKTVKAFSDHLKMAPGTNRLELTHPARELKKWSFEEPNLYYYQMELIDENRKTIDVKMERFGYRSFEIKDGDLYLNGLKTHLRWYSLNNIGTAAADSLVLSSSADFIRDRLMDLRDLGFNGIRCHPNTRLSDRFFDVCDEVGMTASCSLPGLVTGTQNQMYTSRGIFYSQMFNSDMRQWYENLVGPIIEEYYNHPSILFWTVNSCLLWSEYYSQAITGVGNYQDFADGITRDKIKAALIQKNIFLKHDPVRPAVLSALGGRMDEFISTVFYPKLTRPAQETEEWPSEWAKHKAKPLINEEYTSLPVLAISFCDYTNHFQDSGPHGKWTTLYAEYAAQIYGDRGYHMKKLPITNDFRPDTHNSFVLSYYEVEQGKEPFWSPWFNPLKKDEIAWYPKTINEAFMNMLCLYVEKIHKAWRTYDVSGLCLFDHIALTTPTSISASLAFRSGYKREFFKDYADLTTPGPKPDYVHWPVAGEKTPYYHALKKVWGPVLVYLGGRRDNFVAKDHHFFSGEKISKQIIALNDRLTDVGIKVDWWITEKETGRNVFHGKEDMLLHPGDIVKREITFKAPDVETKKSYYIHLSAYKDGKEINSDCFAFRVFPKENPNLPEDAMVIVYDETGLTTEMLSKTGLEFTDLDQTKSLAGCRLLIIGRESLTDKLYERLNELEAGKYFRNGELNILAFEQKPLGDNGLIDKYLGNERSERTVFIRDQLHPVVKGLDNEDFAYWRGVSDLTPAYPSLEEANNLGGYRSTRGMTGLQFKWGNRNVVTSFPLRKFEIGRFKSILDCGFDQLRSPLLEFRQGRGKLILCQLDVANRYNVDPAATRVVNNLLNYALTPSEAAVKTAYLGGEKDKSLLAGLYIKMDQKGISNLDDVGLLIVGQGCEKELRDNKGKIAQFARNGGTVFCLQQPAGMDLSWLPFAVTITERELFRVFIDNEACNNRLLSGLGNSEFYFRDNHKLPVVSSLPAGSFSTVPGIVCEVPYGKGSYVFCQVTPADFANTRTEEKIKRTLVTLLNNCGADTAYSFRFTDPGFARLDLAGKWLFRTDPKETGESNGWHKLAYGDAGWQEINVPDNWENQGITDDNPNYKHEPGLCGPGNPGYKPYDGCGWYRLHLKIPSSQKGARMQLTIGRIDDTDRTYFNGKLIGKTEKNVRDHYKISRNYGIPEELVKFDQDNIVAVRVFDRHGVGGILDGPVEIKVYGNNSEMLYPFVKEFNDFDPAHWLGW